VVAMSGPPSGSDRILPSLVDIFAPEFLLSEGDMSNYSHTEVKLITVEVDLRITRTNEVYKMTLFREHTIGYGRLACAKKLTGGQRSLPLYVLK